MPLPLSVLDFASVRSGKTVGEAFQESVELAQAAERLGYERVWYTEHHNMGSIASAAPAVLIAHIAAQTESIRLGSGGVMLPNHAPLIIAEQFGTLAELHPGRIDLGLGRAPGTDQAAVRAMRRDPRAAEEFPQDVKELQAFLRDESVVPGLRAVPGAGTNVRDVTMDFGYGHAFTEASPEAYERLILDVLLGDPPLFPRHQEVELSWKILDPIEEFWAAEGGPVDQYAPGSWGPASADELLARDGRVWRRP